MRVSADGVAIAPAESIMPLERKWLDRHFGSRILFRNGTQTQIIVRLEASAQGRDGHSLKVCFEEKRSPDHPCLDYAEISLLGGEDKIYPLRLWFEQGQHPALPATGFLKVISPAQKPLFLQITIPEGPYPGIAGYVFLASLVVVALIVSLTIFRLWRKGIHLLDPLGDPNWDFQKSWGSNLVIGGALLTSLLGLKFPDHPWLMTKESLSFLQMVFLALVAIAPLIYGLFHRDVQVQIKSLVGPPTAGIQPQGYILMFLLAGGTTLWGALGQSLLLLLILLELSHAYLVDPLIGIILSGLAVLFFLLVVVYGWRSLYQTASRPKPVAAVEGPPKPVPTLPDGKVLNLAESSVLSEPAPQWSLL